MQRVFRKEQLSLNASGLLQCVVQRLRIEDKVFTEAFREAVSMKRKEEEIFSHDIGKNWPVITTLNFPLPS
jgi:hypothetical protein